MSFTKIIDSTRDLLRNDPNKRWLKILLLIGIGCHLLYLSIRILPSYPNGDGPEYVLMTEALYNHASPDIRISDIESFKKAATRSHKWDQVGRFYDFNDYEAFLKKESHPFMDYHKGMFVSKDNKFYFYHFYTYSLLNVPLRFISQINNFTPLRIYQVTNAIIIIVTCFILLFYSSYKPWPTIFIALSYVFSSVYWYMGWPSPEVLSISLVTLSFWFFFQGKRFLPIFLLAFAGMQNQPLAILAIYISLVVIFEQGIKIKPIARLFFANLLFILPPVFYYYHFGTANLIKDTGILDWGVVTPNRILGFFTDLNQGMILVIPLLLLTYPLLWIRELIAAIKTRDFRHHLLIPFFLIGMISIFCTMINWNHGMAVINRYATWSSAVLMIHAFYMLKGFSLVKQTLIITACFIVQLASVLFNNKYYNHLDWDQNLNKPWAIWVYENIPWIYNPDPNIFFVRTSKSYNFIPEESPVVYLDKAGVLCKILVHKDHLNKLTQWGVPADKLDSLSQTRCYTNGWAYFNKGEIVSDYSAAELLNVKKEARIKILIEDMLRSTEWYKEIQKKAIQNNVSVEEMMRRDAIYLYSLETN
ncbi:MAG: hypothetical protein EYC69_05595 [Bacteroidetes bacterium]|nr:MAG: hypothetical protein EYC69_05595 [Bacteroidota bacterium]